MKKENTVNDLVYYDGLKIVQNDNYFKFSLDSVLLPYFVNINLRTKNILDLCTGNAPVPILLSKKTKSKIYGVEIQKEIFDMGIESVRLNSLEKQIELINDDINNIGNLFNSDTFDIITCNPPYFKSNNKLINNNPVKSLARHEISIDLESIVKISKKLLKNNGMLYFVHRSERIIDIVCMMRNNNIEPKRIRFIYSKKNSTSNIVLISGAKNGKPGIEIMSPLIVHNEDGSYTKEVLKMFGDEKYDTKKL